MLDRSSDREIKICCGTFYQSDFVRVFLGDVLHPGGLELTRHLGDLLELKPEDKVLDIACGRGASAAYLAETFGCHVTGLDYSSENVAAAQAHAATRHVSHLTNFREGDAERLPFDDGSFDAVISECAYCTFPNKVQAGSEMARVLHAGGRVGLTDMTVSGPLPSDAQSLLTWVACIAGCCTAEEYVSGLQKAGFSRMFLEDQTQALLDMVKIVRGKLSMAALAAGFLKSALGDVDLSEAKRLAKLAAELIDAGSVGYALIMGIREEQS